ncbi:Crp/Fnr family transcriptional regulator [Streptomonospora nanhaiensis]|uniref:Crp/Fnr family transcriptional regulator n=1 Tax=Streptomonospora nanhaiensis TaxID=1323731 RepID=UPI001C383C3F|nr:Crp/Fnr family transcriptional regulator [Streptomonospora nanhaiensis]MBV2364493.1 Crp/Fnr family transcriptional regulator [Streptomonospora nanhaiensis]
MVDGDHGGAPVWPAASLLGNLAPGPRGRLLALGARVSYPAGRVLMRESEESTFVLVLLEGVVKATGRAGGEREALLAIRMGGDLVGEFAALDGRPRSATVTTCGPVAARVVARADFVACLHRDPGLMHAVNRAVLAKLRTANSHRLDLTGCDVATRLARVLHEVALTYGRRAGAGAEIPWPLTQPELASLAGAAEPTVHRVLRTLREKGVVATGYRTISITDLARLRDIAFDK